ncbi:MAG: TIGR03619 family F420-dependent LLM class oxidoreductase [Acidimicrobiales bacterium]
MRFSYAEAMCDVTHYLPLAQAADDSGWDSMVIPDSIAYPRDSDSTYPYTADGNREFLQGKPFIEPFVLIPALAAVTSRLRFATFVVKLPIRQPVLVAKQAASIAVMSDNRFSFGIGLSPWPEDFVITGTEWKARGKRMDEMIEIMRGLWTGDFFEYHGDHYDLPAVQICPVPTEPIPLLIGGQTDAALKRAARIGDGWMHAGLGDGSDLGAHIARVRELRAEYGRESDPFEVHVISYDGYTVDGVKRLEDMGVTDVIIGFRDPYTMPDGPLQPKIDALRGFAENVIERCR